MNIGDQEGSYEIYIDWANPVSMPEHDHVNFLNQKREEKMKVDLYSNARYSITARVQQVYGMLEALKSVVTDYQENAAVSAIVDKAHFHLTEITKLSWGHYINELELSPERICQLLDEKMNELEEKKRHLDRLDAEREEANEFNQQG